MKKSKEIMELLKEIVKESLEEMMEEKVGKILYLTIAQLTEIYKKKLRNFEQEGIVI